jgi:hypothetical protein
MSERVPLSQVLCADSDTAVAALEAAGCSVERELSMSVEHPMLGTMHRMFGVLRNVVAEDDPTEEVPGGEVVHIAWRPVELERGVADRSRRFVERVTEMLDHPDNDRLRKRLLAGGMKYTPTNKRLAQGIRKALGDGGAHLPWGLQPLNLDLSMKVQRHCRNFGFVVFYSQAAKLPVGSPPSVELGRVFSTPFGVTGFGTWQEPISQEILDDEVGLLLEANWVGSP